MFLHIVFSVLCFPALVGPCHYRMFFRCENWAASESNRQNKVCKIGNVFVRVINNKISVAHVNIIYV